MGANKLQLFAYTIGILFILLSFVEFGYGNFVLHPQITLYENKIEKYSKIRENLWKLNSDYRRTYSELVNLDWSTYYKVNDGWISEKEGNLTVIGEIPAIYKVDYYFYVNFILNYLDEDYTWLFTDGILQFEYIAPDFATVYYALYDIYEEEIDTDDIIDWTMTIYNASFNYFIWDNTARVLMDWMSSAVAVRISVDFEEFDDEIDDNYLHPLIEAESSLNRLFVISSATTIGLLLLGFLIDFGGVSPSMKKIYLILGLISVGIAVFSSVFSIIRIIMGGL